MKNKRLIKGFTVFILVSLLFLISPYSLAKAREQNGTSYPTLTLKIKWGNVEGDATTRQKTIFAPDIRFNRSIKMTIRKTLRFDGKRHNDWSKEDRIEGGGVAYGSDGLYYYFFSVQSFITHGWDGLKVKWTPADEQSSISVTTLLGAMHITAGELLSSNGYLKQELPEGREIVIELTRVRF